MQWSFAKEIHVSVGTISGEGMGVDLALGFMGFTRTFRAKNFPNDLF